MSPPKPQSSVYELHNHDVNINSGEIYFFGDITETSACFLLKNINLLKDSKKDIKIYLQTEGGDRKSVV